MKNNQAQTNGTGSQNAGLKLSRAEVVRRVNSIGILDGGERHEPSHHTVRGVCHGHRYLRTVTVTTPFPLVDCWGDVSFILDGCHILVLCREAGRRASEVRVCGLPVTKYTPGSDLNTTLSVARKIHSLLGLPLLFSTFQSNVKGGVKDGALTGWDYTPIQEAR